MARLKKENKKVSCQIDKDVYKSFKQVQLDEDLSCLSDAMRFVIKSKGK